MITGVHTLLYARDAGATRAFFRDVLKWKGVDAGEGWLIFALPPGEVAAHPTDDRTSTEMYLMCDDIAKTLSELQAKGVKVLRSVVDQGWGLAAGIEVPGYGEMGLYEPRHPTAIASPKGTRGVARARAAKPSRRAKKKAARRGRK